MTVMRQRRDEHGAAVRPVVPVLRPHRHHGRVHRRSRARPRAPTICTVFRFAGATAFFGYSLAAWPMSIWYKRSWGTTLRLTLDGLIYAPADGGLLRLALAALSGDFSRGRGFLRVRPTSRRGPTRGTRSGRRRCPPRRGAPAGGRRPSARRRRERPRGRRATRGRPRRPSWYGSTPSVRSVGRFSGLRSASRMRTACRRLRPSGSAEELVHARRGGRRDRNRRTP